MPYCYTPVKRNKYINDIITRFDNLDRHFDYLKCLVDTNDGIESEDAEEVNKAIEDIKNEIREVGALINQIDRQVDRQKEGA